MLSHYDYQRSNDEITSSEKIKAYKKFQDNGFRVQVRLKLTGEFTDSWDHKYDKFHEYKLLVDEEDIRRMIDELVEGDIDSIVKSLDIGNTSFLTSVLTGSGWVPYNMLTEEQIISEYEERGE